MFAKSEYPYANKNINIQQNYTRSNNICNGETWS